MTTTKGGGFLSLIKPDFVHILYQGRIVESGGRDLVDRLEETGYGWVKDMHESVEEADEYQYAAAAGGI